MSICNPLVFIQFDSIESSSMEKLDPKPFTVTEILELIAAIQRYFGRKPEILRMCKPQLKATQQTIHGWLTGPGYPILPGGTYDTIFMGIDLTEDLGRNNGNNDMISWVFSEGDLIPDPDRWVRGQPLPGQKQTQNSKQINSDGSLVKNEYNKNSWLEFL